MHEQTLFGVDGLEKFLSEIILHAEKLSSKLSNIPEGNKLQLKMMGVPRGLKIAFWTKDKSKFDESHATGLCLFAELLAPIAEL